MARSSRGARWPRLELEDILEDRRTLGLARELVRRGFLPCAESSLFLVFAAAAHARRLGRDPVALFCSTLRRPELLAECDDSEGHRRAQAARGRVPSACRPESGPVPLAALMDRVLEHAGACRGA